MNKFEALIACRNHWQWLWITNKTKHNYKPSWEWVSRCACCQYVFIAIEQQMTWSSCLRYCPLRYYAWNYHCCDTDSLFNLWNYCDEMERRKYAYMMVQACNRAIEDHILKR